MHVFAHNGHVPDIKSLGRFNSDSFRPIGDTDSEVAFCALLERIRPLWNDRDTIPDLQARLGVVADFASDLGQFGLANFLYCDGDVLFAHGHRRRKLTERSEPRAYSGSIDNARERICMPRRQVFL